MAELDHFLILSRIYWKILRYLYKHAHDAARVSSLCFRVIQVDRDMDRFATYNVVPIQQLGEIININIIINNNIIIILYELGILECRYGCSFLECLWSWL